MNTEDLPPANFVIISPDVMRAALREHYQYNPEQLAVVLQEYFDKRYHKVQLKIVAVKEITNSFEVEYEIDAENLIKIRAAFAHLIPLTDSGD